MSTAPASPSFEDMRQALIDEYLARRAAYYKAMQLGNGSIAYVQMVDLSKLALVILADDVITRRSNDRANL